MEIKMIQLDTTKTVISDAATDPIEMSLQALITAGKGCGYVTWEQMNEILPDEAVTPDKLELIMQNAREERDPSGVQMGPRVDRTQWPEVQLRLSR